MTMIGHRSQVALGNDPFHVLLGAGTQPHGDAAGTQFLERLGFGHETAADREDGAIEAGDHGIEGGALVATIGELATAGQDLADRHARDALDFLHEFDERQAEALGERRAERALAGTTQAEQGEMAARLRQLAAIERGEEVAQPGGIRLAQTLTQPEILHGLFRTCIEEVVERDVQGVGNGDEHAEGGIALRALELGQVTFRYATGERQQASRHAAPRAQPADTPGDERDVIQRCGAFVEAGRGRVHSVQHISEFGIYYMHYNACSSRRLPATVPTLILPGHVPFEAVHARPSRRPHAATRVAGRGHAMNLLAADELPAVLVERPDGRSAFFLTCDHAGHALPRALGDLGLPEAERLRHIGWDIGALAVARDLAARLDATLVAQRYSRLVIDCNRPPTSPDLIPAHSEAIDVPGNHGLSAAARAARLATFHTPYHDRIRALLDARIAAGRGTVYVAVHSFTPVYLGRARPWQIGVLAGADRRLADILLTLLSEDDALTVGDNEPYRIDGKDFGIPEHALTRGLPNVLLELRRDLIGHATGQRTWAARLAEALETARERFVGASGERC